MSDELDDLKAQVELLNNKVYGELDTAVKTIDTKIVCQQDIMSIYTPNYTGVKDIVRSEIYTFLNNITFDDLCKILFDKLLITLTEAEQNDIQTVLKLNGGNYNKVIKHMLRKALE